jgi:uncharacterized protein YcbK (DUF882 family)
MKLTEHFTKEEMIKTNSKLYNEPCQAEFSNLYDLCFNVLEPVRKLLSDYSKKVVSIKITSGYRSFEINEWVNGAKNSQHLNGKAADFIPSSVKITIAYELIRKSNIQYDQLILEPAWIHISYSEKPRRQAWVV